MVPALHQVRAKSNLNVVAPTPSHSIPPKPHPNPTVNIICTFSKDDATTRAVFHPRSRHKCQLRSWSQWSPDVKSQKVARSHKPVIGCIRISWLGHGVFLNKQHFFLVNSTILLVDSPFCLTKTSPLELIKWQFVLVLPFFRWWNITIYIYMCSILKPHVC